MYIIELEKGIWLKNKKLDVTKDKNIALKFKQLNHAKIFVKVTELRSFYVRLRFVSLNRKKIGQR